MMKAYAKINLTLDILDKRKDGLHNLNSVMQTIDLFDELEFKKCDEIIVHSKISDDIIKRTALKIKQLFDVEGGVEIDVKKNIPVGAGLGGGSSDAAATILGLNSLWQLDLDLQSMVNIASELGSDVPFFLYNSCCFVSGFGDVVEPITGYGSDIVLANPGYELSTASAYAKLDKINYPKLHSSFKYAKKPAEFSSDLHNDFIHIQNKDVMDLLLEMKEHGALNSSITGKGPTVFGIFASAKKADHAYNKLINKYPFVYKTKTLI
ncbi:MAG: 4-(cytidine 5'-diphospho)-2-C-methyl-D-erythritol kinase [Nanoarchaeota archaeon]